MSGELKIGIIGDFNPNRRSHGATNEALGHAANHLSAKLEICWLPTEPLLGLEHQKTLEQFDGLWAAPGSPYQSKEGALRGIQFVRERDWPFVGT